MKLHEIAPEEQEEQKQSNSEKLVDFKGRILIIGLGSVGQAIVPIVLRHITDDPKKVTVLEVGEHENLFKERWGSSGIEYVKLAIKKNNIDATLEKYLGEGDLLINVSLNIDGPTIVKWCLENGVFYIDTSIERWEEESDETIPKMNERTLYFAHDQIRKMAAPYKDKAATCVITHGANPGLVTHFTKAALLDIMHAMGHDVDVPESREEWAALMEKSGTKVIHIAERDTQVIDTPKVIGEFVNTWSCEGFWAEGRAPSELGWGTHEDTMPAGGMQHKEGPRNAIYLSQPGVATLIKSWVPLGGHYNGFLVQHSEAITISEYFSKSNGNNVTYRPTVHYAYCPTDAALASVHEFRGQELEMQHVKRIIKDEIVGGVDELGVLLMGGKYNAWWYGSQLDVNTARKLIPNENATSLQVVASMLGAIVWMIKNPKKGMVEPEELDFEEVLAVARPYLGPMASIQSDWKPIEDRNTLFKQKLNPNNPWGFENFRVWS